MNDGQKQKSKINRRRKVRAACKIAPYANAIAVAIVIHASIQKRCESICGHRAHYELLRSSKWSAAIALNNITRQIQIKHERKLSRCMRRRPVRLTHSPPNFWYSSFLIRHTFLFLLPFNRSLHSDRLPNWTGHLSNRVHLHLIRGVVVLFLLFFFFFCFCFNFYAYPNSCAVRHRPVALTSSYAFIYFLNCLLWHVCSHRFT